tara:strand:- start:174 stop:1403 length:1230 start_codon:yes stop_codon:yes gene_type:complete
MKVFDKYFYNIFIVISISIILRFFLIDIYGDNDLQYEWKTLFLNLKDNGILAYRSFDGKLIPSVYMPPLYIYYIFFIDLLITEKINLTKAVLFSQIIVSALSVYFFYKTNLIIFNKKISLISSYIFSLFPIHIFSSLQISSITIQIFLNIFFLYLIIKTINEKKNFRTAILIGVVCGLSVLLRGEFLLIFLSTLIFLFFFKKLNLQYTITIIIISLIVISPYLTRNYLTFGKLTVTKSIGYNLWKGNNIDAGVEGSESLKAFSYDEVRSKINEIPKNKFYDFNYDKVFLESAIKFLKENPTLFFERYVKKFLSFTFLNINSNYPNYNHFLNIFPLGVISIAFIVGVFFGFKNNSIVYKYLIFNIFLTISIFSFFFILPRYKLIILPIQLIFINFILNKYLVNKKKNKGV